MDLPQEFLARMERMLGEEYEAFLRTYEEPRQFGLRVNTLKISVDEFVRLAPFHLRRIPWTDNGFYYEKEDDPARHPFYYAGLYYLQEPSAMFPAAALPVKPGECVLDLCAAPGGKATALAAKLQGRGLLVANEISASRAKALLKNLESFGVTNSFVTNTTANRLAEQFPEAFDKILVDAPCSGEGMFRKDSANARAWSLEKVRACAKLQRELMLQAAAMLRPGGLLLYSTCTFAPEEDEGTVAYLLRQCSELELLELPGAGQFSKGRLAYLRMVGETEGLKDLAEPPHMAGAAGISAGEEAAAAEDALSRCVRLFPHRCSGEGHFLALFRKKAVGEADAAQETAWDAKSKRDIAGTRGKKTEKNRDRELRQAGKANREEEAVLLEFLADVSAPWDRRRIEVRSGQVYYVPEGVAVNGGLPFLRNGLYLGELRRGRFEPSQSFAMALKPGEYASVVDFDQSDVRVRRYLRGETVELDDMMPCRASGWQLVSINGYPLGWGKLVNQTLKNKYHPGWRMPV